MFSDVAVPIMTGKDHALTCEGLLMAEKTTVYAGAMPSRQGQLALEMHGMAPIPVENRYGRAHKTLDNLSLVEL